MTLAKRTLLASAILICTLAIIIFVCLPDSFSQLHRENPFLMMIVLGIPFAVLLVMIRYTRFGKSAQVRIKSWFFGALAITFTGLFAIFGFALLTMLIILDQAFINEFLWFIGIGCFTLYYWWLFWREVKNGTTGRRCFKYSIIALVLILSSFFVGLITYSAQRGVFKRVAIRRSFANVGENVTYGKNWLIDLSGLWGGDLPLFCSFTSPLGLHYLASVEPLQENGLVIDGLQRITLAADTDRSLTYKWLGPLPPTDNTKILMAWHLLEDGVHSIHFTATFDCSRPLADDNDILSDLCAFILALEKDILTN